MIARFFDITSYLCENTATPYLTLTFAAISSYEEVESVRTGLIVPLPVASQHDEKGIEVADDVCVSLGVDLDQAGRVAGPDGASFMDNSTSAAKGTERYPPVGERTRAR